MEGNGSRRRFFFDPSAREGDLVRLSREESRHISRVLRLKVGDSIELLDGRGGLCQAVIRSTERQVEAAIVATVTDQPGDGPTVWVWQGILKGEKMDTVVQKCTELGVTGILPFQSSRCQGKMSGPQVLKKLERWQRIGLAACKQCRRLQTMQIEKPESYGRLLTSKGGGSSFMKLLFWEEEETTHLYDIEGIDRADGVALMLGPEGGFSGEEVEVARRLGWRTVSLGDRVLRAETATLTAVSIVQFLAGNL